jgi:hypothetical protein
MNKALRNPKEFIGWALMVKNKKDIARVKNIAIDVSPNIELLREKLCPKYEIVKVRVTYID